MSLYLIPLLAAITGWFTNKVTISLFLKGFVKRQSVFAEQTGAFVATQLFSFDDIRHQLSQPDKINGMIPIVEAHMDTFLRVKLPEAMPVFKMFIGDSTIQQVKQILVGELDKMFPAIIDQYLEQTAKELDIQQLVSRNIMSIPARTFTSQIRISLRKELLLAELGGAVLGLLIGLIQLMIALHQQN